jgi:hypothetical protein
MTPIGDMYTGRGPAALKVMTADGPLYGHTPQTAQEVALAAERMDRPVTILTRHDPAAENVRLRLEQLGLHVPPQTDVLHISAFPAGGPHPVDITMALRGREIPVALYNGQMTVGAQSMDSFAQRHAVEALEPVLKERMTPAQINRLARQGAVELHATNASEASSLVTRATRWAAKTFGMSETTHALATATTDYGTRVFITAGDVSRLLQATENALGRLTRDFPMKDIIAQALRRAAMA